MKNLSFELSNPWAIFLAVVIFALGFFGGYLYTDQSLKVENASLRANIPGGRAAGEERQALKKREEDITRRENNADQRENEIDHRISKFNSTVRSTGKSEGIAEQLRENNEVINQSFNGVLWERNILMVIVSVSIIAFAYIGLLYVPQLKYLINIRAVALEAILSKARHSNGNIDEIITVIETSTQFIKSEQSSKQKTLGSGDKTA